MKTIVYQDDGWTMGTGWFDKAQYNTQSEAQDDRERQLEESRRGGSTRYRIVERISEQTILLEDRL